MEPITVPFAYPVDLEATMDIQIPALAWQQNTAGWRRIYRVEGASIQVTVAAEQTNANALRFDLAPAPGEPAQTPARGLAPAAHRQLEAKLRSHFPRQIASLDLSSHPALQAMHDRYAGVIIMHADVIEALVLTILSQNRTGEIVRKVYPNLDARCRGVTATSLTALPEDELAGLIRSAGPYKAPRLAAAARLIAAEGQAVFTKTTTDGPFDQALDQLISLPGVAHKTAACVLVFAAEQTLTLPVDTHLFRVAHRLGLATHNGKLNPRTREAIISALLTHGPDLAPAHFLFLLLGRTTCTAESPRCADCFAQPVCPTGSRTPRSPQ